MDANFLRKQVNSSGFPFQVRIAHEILKTANAHKWELLTEEHRWQVAEREGFADLVVWKEMRSILTFRSISMVLILECKRVREGAWVFLAPAIDHPIPNRGFLTGSSLYPPAWWRITWYHRGDQTDEGPAAAYCAVPGQSDRGTPMLERIASQLLQATESIGAQHQERLATRSPQQPNVPALFFPIVVTNASLLLADFPVEAISLHAGDLPDAETTFTKQPFVRFQKSFTTLPVGEKKETRLDSANYQDQRTIWIVQASYLARFLEGWALNVDDTLPDNIF